MTRASRYAIAAVLSLLALAPALSACGNDKAPAAQRQKAIAAAKDAYREARAKGVDLAPGPCISERLPGAGDWVADVAHDPRQAVDDEPANQCQRYRDGKAKHFVELTPGGRVTRAE
jgi:hypothetical protein